MAEAHGCRQILFATDFSDGARHAFQYAEHFARTFSARIDVAHILALHQDDPEQAEQALPGCVPAAAADLVDTRRALRALSPELGIVHAAREAGSDLIVMGTHGRTGLRHVFMGSVAERVVQLAHCPVLTVRQPGHDFLHP